MFLQNFVHFFVYFDVIGLGAIIIYKVYKDVQNQSLDPKPSGFRAVLRAVLLHPKIFYMLILMLTITILFVIDSFRITPAFFFFLSFGLLFPLCSNRFPGSKMTVVGALPIMLTVLLARVLLNYGYMWVHLLSMLVVAVIFQVIAVVVLHRRRQLKDYVADLEERYNKRVVEMRIIDDEEFNPPKKIALEEVFSDFMIYMKDTKAYLDPNISLASIASAICTNRTYLSEAIKVFTGLTYTDCIIKLRVEYAIKLLKKEGYTDGSRLAKMSGYKSIGALHYDFKKITGYTPKEYWRFILDDKPRV